MRFMMLLKANAETESGVMPTRELMEAMNQYNEEMVRAGVLLDGAGLKGSAHGARVYFEGESRRVVDGPFAETKELIAGFWMIQAKSLAEAIEWAKRCPPPHFTIDAQIELRQVFDIADFPPEVLPDSLRAQLEQA